MKHWLKLNVDTMLGSCKAFVVVVLRNEEVVCCNMVLESELQLTHAF